MAHNESLVACNGNGGWTTKSGFEAPFSFKGMVGEESIAVLAWGNAMSELK